MNPPAAHEPEIRPVSAEGHAEALRLVFGRLAAEDRRRQVEAVLGGVKAHELSLPGLLGARRHGRLVGAAFSQIQPGKTAVLWPPRIVTGEPQTTAGELLTTTCDWLARRHVCTAQVLLQTDTPSDVAVLRKGGFERLADLLYLVSPEDVFPSSPPTTPLHFEPYCPASHGRLARIVEATYQQTLDCPQLNGVREVEDVLAGYRAAGVFDPRRWLIVGHGGQDVGCLLLADHPDHSNWELVYMGLVVSVRGRSWGMDVARKAQWLTRQAGRPRLVLAVDEANQPAIRIYTAVGFQAWDRRSVYLKVFRSMR